MLGRVLELTAWMGPGTIKGLANYLQGAGIVSFKGFRGFERAVQLQSPLKCRLSAPLSEPWGSKVGPAYTLGSKLGTIFILGAQGEQPSKDIL